MLYFKTRMKTKLFLYSKRGVLNSHQSVKQKAEGLHLEKKRKLEKEKRKKEKQVGQMSILIEK